MTPGIGAGIVGAGRADGWCSLAVVAVVVEDDNDDDGENDDVNDGLAGGSGVSFGFAAVGNEGALFVRIGAGVVVVGLLRGGGGGGGTDEDWVEED